MLYRQSIRRLFVGSQNAPTSLNEMNGAVPYAWADEFAIFNTIKAIYIYIYILYTHNTLPDVKTNF